MRSNNSLILFFLLFFGIVNSVYPAAPPRLAPNDILLSPDGSILYVLQKEGRCLTRLALKDTADSKKGDMTSLSLPMTPERMSWFPKKDRIAIAGGGVDGGVMTVRVDSPISADKAAGKTVNSNKSAKKEKTSLSRSFMTFEKTVRTGHTPSATAVGEESSGKITIYVTNQFSGTVTAVDYQLGKVVKSWPVGREPSAIVYSSRYSKLVVANLLPEMDADNGYSSSSARVIDLKTDKITKIDFLNGVSNIRDVALSPNGRYAFLPGTQGNFQVVTTQVVGGWIMENVVSVVDVEDSESVDTFFLDDSTLGAPNPWSVACSSDGKYLVISVSGTDDLLFMPLDRIQKILDNRPHGQRPGNGAYTYTYQGKGKIDFPIRVRIKLGIKGLRRLVVENGTAYCVSRFEDAVGVVAMELKPPFENFPNSYVRTRPAPKPLDPKTDVAPSNSNRATFVALEPDEPLKGITAHRSLIRLGSKPDWEEDRVLYGEMVFHDATPCMEHWLSCVSCHPDGRMDGLNWDLVNDGLGNPKNTKSMLLSHETPPSMITGVRKDAETAVRAGVEHLLYGIVNENDCAAMDDYLMSLKPVPSPYLVNGKLSESAQRGRFIFQGRAGCSSCHPEPYYTDLNLHRVKTYDPFDTYSKYDTPALIEVWRTAPYLNTGHYTTVKDVLLKGKHGNEKGQLDKLTDKEIDDLVEYVLSL